MDSTGIVAFCIDMEIFTNFYQRIGTGQGIGSRVFSNQYS
jgi:hypothetical protein